MKLTGIKKAVGVAKESCSYIIYMDITTGEVWCNEYTNQNSWTEYDDENIVRVVSGRGNMNLFGGDGITMKQLAEDCEMVLRNHGETERC